MANKKPKQMKSAPTIEPAKKDLNVNPENPEVLPSKKIAGLSQDSKVLYADLMQRRYIEHPQSDAAFSKPFIDGINALIDATVISIAMDEAVCGNGSLSIFMKKSPALVGVLQEMAHNMGLSVPMLEALPSATQEELDKQGIKEKPEEVVKISVKKENITEEAKARVEAEHKAAEEDVEMDVTKMTSKDMLKAALKKIMLNKMNVFTNFVDASAMYASYMQLQAEKKGDKKAAEEAKNASFMSNLRAVTKLVGECPIIIHGFGNFLYTDISQKKHPVAAFCHLRNSAKNKSTGVPCVDDKTIADVLSVIVTWVGEYRIEQQKKNIQTAKEDIELLKKDEKKNAEGIKNAKEQIATYNRNLKHITDVMSYVTSPSFDVADNFEKEISDGDADARRLFGFIVNSYYNKNIVEESNMADIRHNVQVYIGVILNMFCDSVETNDNYSESDFVELRKKETAEESKN